MAKLHEDAAHWADRALDLASRHSLITACEVRAQLEEDRTFVRRTGLTLANRVRHIGGIGIRAHHDAGTGYAYTNDASDRTLRQIVDRAARMAATNAQAQPGGNDLDLGPPRRVRHAPSLNDDPLEAGDEAIHPLLERAEQGALAEKPGVKPQVAFGYRRDTDIVADSVGSWVETTFLQSTLIAQAVAREADRIGDGHAWLGGARGIGDYEVDGGPEALGAKAARDAQEGLHARAIPGGRYRCLTDNHLTGLMAHESFGHLTEFDLIASGWSVLRGRLGERLANEKVSIHDVPVYDEGRGGISLPYDSEGTPARPVTLLDKGVLKGHMHLRDSATGAGVAPTGNGRALNVEHPPIVRMRNTYVGPGDLTMEEALEELRDGVYLIMGRGGSPRADGSFMFTAQRGYKVENGEIVHPLRMVSIYGNVLDFLQRVEGLTRDVSLHTTYFGGCGKWDQSFLHVGTGGPHALVSEALIGGQGR